MQLNITKLLLAGCVALAGCSSSTERLEPLEHAKPDEVMAFFGENITYRKGSAATSTGPGNYLEITVHDDKLAQQYGDLALPASNCAYLSYKNLPPTERQAYAYLKVTMPAGLGTQSYTFARAELALATQAATDLDTLMTHFKNRNYQAVANAFDAAVLTPAMRAQLLNALAAAEQKTGPVQQYYLEGYAPAPVKTPQPETQPHLMQLFVTLSYAPKAGRMLVVINPMRHPNEKFLYDLNILD